MNIVSRAIVAIVVTATAGTANAQTGGQGRGPGSTPRPAATRPAKPPAKPDAPPFSAEALQLQVLLDRARFSIGEIDGTLGTNTQKAMAAFTSARGLDAASPTAVLLGALGRDTPATITYTITPDDLAGPFADQIPHDLMAQAKLPALNYSSPLELLAERFHTSPTLLKRLNPAVAFSEGAEIQVPNVEPFQVPTRSEATAAARAAAVPEAPAPDVTVTISRSLAAMTVTDANGALVLYAPVTSGSAHDPLPIGSWTITTITRNPTFNYNPELFWDARADQTKARIPAGPNGPVGVVWIGLNKEHYGLHGTPEPSQIGHTASHGCVRLTNWDAMRLAALVKKGTAVVFVE